MVCRGCGRDNPEGARFCNGCGVGLASGARQPEAASATAAPRDEDINVFVGRQREMQLLESALEQALAGQGRLVMLAGEPGIGKTRTATEIAELARARNARVLWGRCYESQGAPPYWPWVQAIRSYVRDQEPERLRSELGAGGPDIAEIVPELRDLFPDLLPTDPVGDTEQSRFRLFDSVTSFLKGASEDQPLVIVLDNLHGADQPSLLLLEFMASQLEDARLLVLGTYRDSELSLQHPLTETLGQLSRDRPVERISLRGLSVAAVERFLASVTTDATPYRLAQAIYEQTEGNPLFVTEVVRLLWEEGLLLQPTGPQGRPVSLGIPEGVREVIGMRLNRLSEGCRQTLAIASVIGREFAVSELERLADHLTEERLLEALEEATATRVIEEVPQTVGRYQFSHVLIRETLYDDMTSARRARLHRRIGEVMEEVYGTDLDPYLAQLAHHFFQAAGVGGAHDALEYAQQAGERDNALLAFEEAARHFDMALSALDMTEPTNEPKRCGLLLALADAHRRAGQFPRAIEAFDKAFELAKAIGSSEDMAQAAIGYDWATWPPGLSGEPAVRLLRQALEVVSKDDSPLRARLLASLSRALSFTESADEGMEAGREADAMANRLGDPTISVATLRSLAFSYIRLGIAQYSKPLGTLARSIRLIAEGTRDDEALLDALNWELNSQLSDGQDAGAFRRALDEYIAKAAQLRQPHYVYLGLVWQAAWATAEGRFQQAEKMAEEARDYGLRLHTEGVDGSFALQMFTIWRDRGRLGELAPLVKSFVQEQSSAAIWRPGLALIYSELGLLDEARAQFDQMAENDFADLPGDALWVSHMAYLTEVCAALGDAERARHLYSQLLPIRNKGLASGAMIVYYGSSSYYLGLLASVMSRWDDAEEYFREAIEMCGRMGAAPHQARAELRYAEALLSRRQSRDAEQAHTLLNQALQTARDLGMASVEARARSMLETISTSAKSPDAYPDGLTHREVDVLRLIAAGTSNRDIAAKLFISYNTVANHVTGILSKTGAANRTEAAAYATRNGLTEQ